MTHNPTTPNERASLDAAADALGDFSTNAASRAALHYLEHHGLEADPAALAEALQEKVKAAIPQAMDDAREALGCPNGEVMAQTTYGASMALAGIDAAKSVGRPKSAPAVYSYPCERAQWDAFIAAMHSGERVEIDRGMFDYWLDVLPPVLWRETVPMPDGTRRQVAFGFAEGEEPVVGFWHEGSRYFCQRTALVNRGS